MASRISLVTLVWPLATFVTAACTVSPRPADAEPGAPEMAAESHAAAGAHEPGEAPSAVDHAAGDHDHPEALAQADGHDHVHGEAAPAAGTGHGVAAAGEHHHDSPHGGQVVTVGEFHVELVADGRRLVVYPLTEDMAAVALVATDSASATVSAGTDVISATMTVDGDHFFATLDADLAPPFIAVVQATFAGATHTARFQTAAEPAAVAPPREDHHDGNPAGHEHVHK